jgi:hypothetical protein
MQASPANQAFARVTGRSPCEPIARLPLGSFTDPFRLNWGVATHREDLTPEELESRAQAFFKQMAAQQNR